MDPETVRRIKRARADGLSFRELAARFGFSTSTFRRLLQGRDGGAP